MTKVQHIISEIHELEMNELEEVLREILSKIEIAQRIESILDEYVGAGKGVWDIEAQEYVNQLRQEEA